MGRKSVRAAVLSFIAPPNVAGLRAVHRSMPKLTVPQEINLAAGGGSGAVGIIHVRRDVDRPESLPLGIGAPAGFKGIDYTVGIVLRFWSVKTDAEVAMDDFDDMVDALKARLRSDTQFGTGGSPIFSGGLDMRMESNLPRQDGGSTFIWSVLETTVTEQIQA